MSSRAVVVGKTAVTSRFDHYQECTAAAAGRIQTRRLDYRTADSDLAVDCDAQAGCFEHLLLQDQHRMEPGDQRRGLQKKRD